VPFHHEDSALWPYPRAPLDDRDDIVELDFADTSALSDVDAFEQRRLNGRNGLKLSKKDREREREEIERSWDVPGGTPIINNAGTRVALRRPSSQAPAGSNTVWGSPSPYPQTSALEANQPQTTSSPVKSPETSTAAPAPAAPPNDNKSKSKSKAKAKPAANGSNNNNSNSNVKARVRTAAPDTTTPASSGALAKSTASTAIVEAMHAHSNGNATLGMMDRDEFVREVHTLIDVSVCFSSSPLFLF
jgi:hypothetical protein